VSQDGRPTQPAFRRLDVWFTLLGILGLILFLAFYDQAFPSAAIELTLSQGEIIERSRSYFWDRGYDLRGYESALAFQQASWASVYLQRTLGIAATNRLVAEERLPIWYWHVRWFRPLQKEEFSLWLAPDGEVVGLSHSIMEDVPGASLSQEEARTVAEDYVESDRQWSLERWEPVTASTREQPSGRTDHHFEWKSRDFAVGESELRLAVDVQGDEVGGYDYWLKVPEAFRRRFSEQANRASFFSDLSSTVGDGIFGLAALFAYLLALRRGVLQWHSGLGPALAVGLVSMLAGLNRLPLAKSWYGTTQDYTMFWVNRVIGVLYSAGFNGVMILVLWAGGQRLSKAVWPRQDKVLPRGVDRWAVLARSGWRGLMLGGLMAGYVVAFYLVATRLLGGWTPMGSPYTSAFATPLPFLDPLRSGAIPAAWEELTFRLIGISLLLWVTRRRPLALLVPAALWAFAHLSYVRDPFYLRGIELLIPAVFLLGLSFLRFDLTTSIVAHFAYNAGLTALPLLRSGEPRFVASGWVVIATMMAPVIPGVVQELRRRLRGQRISVPLPQFALANVEDADQLAALPVQDVSWAELLADQRAAVLCLRSGEELVGAAAGRVQADGTARIWTIYVAPTWRRQYWGSKLVHELSLALRERGAERLTATLRTKDRAATIFWSNQGWQPAVQVFHRSLAVPAQPAWREAISRLRSRLRRPGTAGSDDEDAQLQDVD
jgi:GNAT superfamily N-acetyltransferase